MKKLGVVIVTYNRLELLKECIYNCINQSYKFNKIIIVNNASSDGTEEYLRHLTYDNVVIVTSKENFGGAGGYYLGVKEAKKYNLDYLLFIDDDAIIDEDYNKNIVNAITSNVYAYSGTVKTNGIIQYEHRRHLKRGFKSYNSFKAEYEKKYFDYELSSFCGLYVSMDIIKKIGLPNKDFFIWFDDTEYSLRIIKYSKIRNINNAIINHKTKIANEKGYNWKSYYSIRNQIYILKKYYGRKELNKFLFKCKLIQLKHKILAFIKNKEYHKNIIKLYEEAISDGINSQLGKKKKGEFNL